MLSHRSPNFGLDVLAILLYLTTRASASPQHFKNNPSTTTITSPLSKRATDTNTNTESSIHLGPGPVVAIVLGTLAITAISIWRCCPCWKKCKGGKQKLQPHPYASEINGTDQNQNQMHELGGNRGVGRHELHDDDTPPRYEEIQPGGVVDGRAPDWDGKGVRDGVSEVSSMGARNELDSDVGPRTMAPAHVK